jgi:hypothetical protein
MACPDCDGPVDDRGRLGEELRFDCTSGECKIHSMRPIIRCPVTREWTTVKGRLVEVHAPFDDNHPRASDSNGYCRRIPAVGRNERGANDPTTWTVHPPMTDRRRCVGVLATQRAALHSRPACRQNSRMWAPSDKHP